jgi:hypothetical protein
VAPHGHGFAGSWRLARRRRRLLHRVLVGLERRRLRFHPLLARQRLALDDLEEDDRDVVDPPIPVRRRDERLRGGVRVLPGGEDEACDLGVADDVRETVGADQVQVARRRLDGKGFDLEARLRPDRARDDGAMRMLLRLLRRELSRPDELPDERVVGCELLEDSVAEPVGAGVADVTDRDLPGVLVDEQRGDHGSHACGQRIFDACL